MDLQPSTCEAPIGQASQPATKEFHTWTWWAMLWEPDPLLFNRAPGHPRRRWSDDFADFLKENQIDIPWHKALQDASIFESMLAQLFTP